MNAVKKRFESVCRFDVVVAQNAVECDAERKIESDGQ